MKRLLVLLPAGLVVGGLTFAATYWFAGRSSRSLSTAADSETAWLRKEFRLSEAEFQRVAKLHADYKPTCTDLCRRITEQNERLREAALATNTVTEELRRFMAETGRVRDECRLAMLDHLYAVAKEMPPAEGRRYLELMLTSTCILQKARSLDSAHSHENHE